MEDFKNCALLEFQIGVQFSLLVESRGLAWSTSCSCLLVKTSVRYLSCSLTSLGSFTHAIHLPLLYLRVNSPLKKRKKDPYKFEQCRKKQVEPSQILNMLVRPHYTGSKFQMSFAIPHLSLAILGLHQNLYAAKLFAINTIALYSLYPLMEFPFCFKDQGTDPKVSFSCKTPHPVPPSTISLIPVHLDPYSFSLFHSISEGENTPFSSPFVTLNVSEDIYLEESPFPGLPRWLMVKVSTCQCKRPRDLGPIPGWE